MALEPHRIEEWLAVLAQAVEQRISGISREHLVDEEDRLRVGFAGGV